MVDWQGFLIGVLSGVVATLLADNAHVRFHLEKWVRRVLRRKLISVKLSSFKNHCKDGYFIVHCIEIQNNMWFTPTIPQVYLRSRGAFDYDSSAYKPLIYFRSRGMSDFQPDVTSSQMLSEFSSKIAPYTPADASLSINIARQFPVRIAVICEAIPLQEVGEEGVALNHQKVVGHLYAAVANPMPSVGAGSWWYTDVISQDFGFIDVLHITVPKDLREREPLGDSMEVIKMAERPPCLLDVGCWSLTWPLRFNVNSVEITVRRSTRDVYPKICVKKKKTKISRVIRRLLLKFSSWMTLGRSSRWDSKIKVQ